MRADGGGDPAADAGTTREIPDGQPGTEPTGRLRATLRRLHAWREDVRRRPNRHRIYKATVGVVGGAIVVGGLALVPLPGPGWVIVFIGLAILASEFERADRVQQFARRQVHAWTVWLKAQSWPIRVTVAATTALVVGCVFWALAAVTGVPGWVPDWLVPPLPGLE